MHFYRALIIYSCFIDTYGEKKQKVTTHTLTHTVVNLGILLGFFVCFFLRFGKPYLWFLFPFSEWVLQMLIKT